MLPLGKLQDELSTTGLNEMLSIEFKIIQESLAHPLSSVMVMQ